jgi:hypothetical protein
VNRSTPAHRSRAFAGLATIFFFFSGVFFVPHLGLQNDETLFASPLFPPKGWFYRIRLFHSDIALLLMSYLGTLKTLIYIWIFRWFGTRQDATRIPMLIAGSIGIWLFFRLLSRVAGDRAACIGCTLLAADSLYLLTTCFDWGPVALQHLLMIGGLLLVVRFYQEKRSLSLFGAFLLFGLAVWDKALALWMLSGMFVAGVVVFPRRIFVTNFRHIGIAACGFCLGASPFLIYNLTHRFATLRENSSRDFTDVSGRARLVRNTLDGQGMFGWLVEEDAGTPSPHAPANPVEKVSAAISAAAAHPREDLMFYGLLLALALAPLARGSDLRAILFSAVAMAVAWIQMATTRDAGGSVHHIILLWPFPTMIIAVSFAAASRRLGRAGLPAAIAITAVLAGSEVLVTNEYYAVMVRNGGTVPWSDAIYTLSDYLKSGPPARSVACVDWGIMDSLRLLNRGALPLRWGGDEDDASISAAADGGTLYLGHAPGREIFPGKTEKLVGRATALGLRREMLAVIADSYGRPTFEVFRLRK